MTTARSGRRNSRTSRRATTNDPGGTATDDPERATPSSNQQLIRQRRSCNETGDPIARGRSIDRPETDPADTGKTRALLNAMLIESCVSTCTSSPLEFAERVRGQEEGGGGSSVGNEDGSAPSGKEKCQCHSLLADARSPPWNRATCSADGADVAWSCPQTSGPCHNDNTSMSRIANAIRPQPVVRK